MTTTKQIKLSEVRSAMKNEKGSLSHFCKVLYTFECKELKSLLPKSMKEFLNVTPIIAQEMGIGLTYETTFKGEKVFRTRKPSADLVIRFLVKHQNDLADIMAKRNAEVEQMRAEAKADKAAKKAA